MVGVELRAAVAPACQRSLKARRGPARHGACWARTNMSTRRAAAAPRRERHIGCAGQRDVRRREWRTPRRPAVINQGGPAVASVVALCDRGGMVPIALDYAPFARHRDDQRRTKVRLATPAASPPSSASLTVAAHT